MCMQEKMERRLRLPRRCIIYLIDCEVTVLLFISRRGHSHCGSLLQPGSNKISQKYNGEHKCSLLLASHTHICGILVGFTLKVKVFDDVILAGQN